LQGSPVLAPVTPEEVLPQKIKAKPISLCQKGRNRDVVQPLTMSTERLSKNVGSGREIFSEVFLNLSQAKSVMLDQGVLDLFVSTCEIGRRKVCGLSEAHTPKIKIPTFVCQSNQSCLQGSR